ncbi:MAG: glycosyltransferase [Acidobacteriia bacterium]|nr:glycosyltransferase [Terriglobia bacterium]
MNPGRAPRVAFFTDSFHEVNGVALTSRQFDHHARSHFYPFLSVHPGPRTAHWTRGNYQALELSHSSASLRLEHDLAFDLCFWRHRRAVRRAVEAFRPDLVHVTGPGHIGMLGALIAYDLGVPLVASWHTNVHEFGSRRLRKLLGGIPQSWTRAITHLAERKSLDLTVRFYRLARMMFAPNPELVAMLASRTARPAFLMQRGIDTEMFSPTRRTRSAGPFVIGYVGRLSAEKNVRLFVRLNELLKTHGLRDYRFLVVGDGSERAWLRQHLENADFPGLLHGTELADAYASMDVLVFPSETDTFGNVILEALASGVPAIVSGRGGPKFLIDDGVTGFVAQDPEAIADKVAELYVDPQRRDKMCKAARQAALGRSWDAVFASVYDHYRQGLDDGALSRVSSSPESPWFRSKLRSAL